MKRRVNDVIAKTRGRFPLKNFPSIMDAPTMDLMDSIKPKDRRAVERFLCYSTGHFMRPKVLVRYDREPWMSEIDDYARVTMDYAVRACTATDYSFQPESDWRYIDDALSMREHQSLVILELKFESERMPMWLSNLVRTLGLNRRSFSKYGRGIEAWFSEVRMDNKWSKIAS